MKKGIICILICMLMLASTGFPLTSASYQQKTSNNDSEGHKEFINRNIHHGFVIGYFSTITWVEERCILTTDGGAYPHNLPITFIIPFQHMYCAPNKQIQLVNPKFCFFHNNFVIGFSKILFPESTLSMHIISQIDDFNTIRWVVDAIEGDSVWGGNLDAKLYLQNGSEVGGISTGPYPWKPAYLSIGDEFKVTVDMDGTYQMKLVDTISGHVLFVSPFLHF